MASFNPRSTLKIAAISGAFLFLAVYGLFQANKFIIGPEIIIIAPQNGETIASSSPEVMLRGTARNISFITINGLQTFTDEHGNFVRKLLLPEGFAIITVEARDKFNRSVKKEIQLFVK